MWWWSDVSHHRTKAVFVSYDEQGDPRRDCILAIPIGTRVNKITQSFRWPLKFIEPKNGDG